MRPIYCDRYGPMKPYVRGLSRSKRVAEIWGLKVSIFCYLVIIFSCVMLGMKNFEIHNTDRCYQKKHLEFFLEFFVHILLQQRELKWQNRVFFNLNLAVGAGHERKILEKIPDVLLDTIYRWCEFQSFPSETSHLKK